jgi:hypothetical protein
LLGWRLTPQVLLEILLELEILNRLKISEVKRKKINQGCQSHLAASPTLTDQGLPGVQMLGLLGQRSLEIFHQLAKEQVFQSTLPKMPQAIFGQLHPSLSQKLQ